MCFVYRCGRNAEWLRNREGWTAWRGGKRRTWRGSTRNAKRRANEPPCDSTRFGKFYFNSRTGNVTDVVFCLTLTARCQRRSARHLLEPQPVPPRNHRRGVGTMQSRATRRGLRHRRQVRHHQRRRGRLRPEPNNQKMGTHRKFLSTLVLYGQLVFCL